MDSRNMSAGAGLFFKLELSMLFVLLYSPCEAGCFNVKHSETPTYDAGNLQTPEGNTPCI